MNKFLKTLICTVLCGSMVFAVACNNNGDDGDPIDGGNPNQKYPTETRALNLAIGALDKNFNPFFYTSANDGEVISMTQASLIGVTNDGKPAVGDDYPVVAQDYSETYYDAVTGGSVTNSAALAAESGRTEYEFLIKNGMKFSDGKDLTIKDVLFNFYVYLDPVYTGSNTMYSVDIQGLKAYQYNNAQAGDDYDNSSYYAQQAQQRIRDIVNWSTSQPGAPSREAIAKDLALVESLFTEELNSDWSAIETSWQTTYKTNYTFEYAWQAYLYQEGIVEVQMRKNDNGTTYAIRVDENGNEIERYGSDGKETDAYKNGKNLTNLDPYAERVDGHSDQAGTIGLADVIEEIEKATTDEKIAKYIADNDVVMDTQEEAEAYAYLMLTKEYCINKVYDTNLGSRTGYATVVQWWATASSVYNAFFAEERGKDIENSNDPIYYIRGIQTYKTSNFKGKALGEEHDVLKIVINGVDPAAIWNFGVSIAPLHYYSGKYTYKDDNGITVTKDFAKDFNGHLNNGTGGNDSNTCFGVKRGDWTFFEQVVKGTAEKVSKSKLPIGAGAYRASDRNGNPTEDGTQFENNQIVYYQRNEYFHTMGANIENAKIKYLRYKVMEDDRIIPSLESNQIDYGEPSATPTNQNLVDGNDKYRIINYDTNGYGYVGLNPTYVQDINIRRIIMRAMNTGSSVRYYGDLANVINRPMSTTSWAYPKNVGVYPGLEPFASSAAIKAELESLGYRDSNGNGTYEDAYGNELVYTFTIAGANSDHPAYQMFFEAAELLNNAGFRIDVSTNPNALKNLAEGTLAIWAAAYSTAVDPDMYQVYHKGSQATSILNWGYKTILDDQTGKYNTEKGIINYLSELIEDARKTVDQDERINLYAQALDQIMELAIQLPLYQRKDLCVMNKTVLDVNTVNLNADHINGVLSRIWEVNYL